MSERTVLLIKPDAVQRGLNFEIAERFERRSFKLAACRMVQPTVSQAEQHYGLQKNNPACKESVAFLTSGPVVVMAWEGPGAIAAALAMVGDNDPSRAELGTVRADLAIEPRLNLVEVSPDAASATKEQAIWFTAEDFVSSTGASPSPVASTPSAAPKAAAPLPAAAPASGSVAADEDAAADNSGKSKRQLAKEAKKAEKEVKKAGHKKVSAGIPPPLEPTKPPVSYEPPSGTRDFFPDAMRVRNWLFAKFRDTARSFAFEEYDAPVLEREELYKRKGGEEITEQMYNFVDKDGKNVTLRPEMTPTLARMILSLGGKIYLPAKWFSVPQCWRFETVQRGRKREHYQWNMDIIGEPSITAEVELLAGVVRFFQSVGITSADVGIKVNSRKVLSSILTKYGVTDDKFAEVCVIVDKLDKIGEEAVIELLVEKTLPRDAATKIVQSLSLRSVAELKNLVGGEGGAAVEELLTLFDLADAYGFGDWLLFDASVVRGLAYYTGIVFEGFDRRGELRAICGGGRYDKLLTLYGSPTVVPACGFGFGDCVIMELLEERGLLPTLKPQVDFVVVAYNDDMRRHAVQVAALLRKADFAVDMLLDPKKPKKAFEYADKKEGRRVMFVAPGEWAAGNVRMKDMLETDTEAKEVDLPFDGLLAALKGLGISPM